MRRRGRRPPNLGDGYEHVQCTLIRGLGFEPIYPRGHVQLYKLDDEFTPLEWPGEFTINARIDLPLLQDQDEGGIPDSINACGDLLANIYNSILNTVSTSKWLFFAGLQLDQK